MDISGGIASLNQSNVTTMDFTAFNAQEATLLAAGVRKTKTTSTLAQDLEPEFITIAPNSEKAWVSLQENNSIAEIDLVNKTITSIWSMGTKDHMQFGNGMDVSDRNPDNHLSSWPVKGYYMPDAIAYYEVSGTPYILTANEGDEREYSGHTERAAVSSLKLDSVAFPHREVLQKEYNMGRFRISNFQGDTDNDGDFDELYCVGARSFSIINAVTGDQVYDSGDELERITSVHPLSATVFNADHEGNAPKARSRAKGIEPEGILVAEIAGTNYVFISLERTGGVMVYDISNPMAPVFTDYINTRTLNTYGGDNGPEGLIYIPASASPNQKPYIICANEVSGTLAVFEISGNINSSLSSFTGAENRLKVWPNPNNGGVLYLAGSYSGQVYSVTGTKVLDFENVNHLDLQALAKGLYLIKTTSGASAVVVVD